MTPSRPLRADAARNRAQVLAAAAKEFAEHGAEASVAEIARRAGVGKGTVFRHFPTKSDLLAAVVVERVGDLAATGRRLLDVPDPGRALLRFLTDAADQRERLDLSFVQDSPALTALTASARQDLFDVVHRLVDRARDQGAVRADVTGTDVILLMCAPSHVVSYVADAPPDLWRRYLGIIFDGLRPQGAHELVHPPPPGP